MKASNFKPSITAEKAQAILSAEGLVVTTNQAALILDFLYKMAALEIADLETKK